MTQDEVRERLNYDPITGLFTWRTPISYRLKVGQAAGACSRYQVIRIGHARYYAHRLAWLYIYGHWPPEEIDHINRDKLDNRIANLRCASSSENKLNRARYPYLERGRV